MCFLIHTFVIFYLNISHLPFHYVMYNHTYAYLQAYKYTYLPSYIICWIVLSYLIAPYDHIFLVAIYPKFCTWLFNFPIKLVISYSISFSFIYLFLISCFYNYSFLPFCKLSQLYPRSFRSFPFRVSFLFLWCPVLLICYSLPCLWHLLIAFFIFNE